MKKRSQGFTLIEMLLVIGLLIGMAALSTQSYIQDFEDKQIERDVIDMMTIANAAVAYTYSHGYKWPDEAGICGALLTELGADGYFNAGSLIGATTRCPDPAPGSNQPRMLNVSYTYMEGSTDHKHEMAVAMAGMLPWAEQVAVGSATVNMKLLKPRGGLGVQIEAGNATDVFFPISAGENRQGIVIEKPDCLNPQLFITTSSICDAGNRGVRGIRIEKNNYTPGFWQVYVEVDTTTSVAGLNFWGWENIYDCDGDEIEFSYVRSCL